MYFNQRSEELPSNDDVIQLSYLLIIHQCLLQSFQGLCENHSFLLEYHHHDFSILIAKLKLGNFALKLNSFLKKLKNLGVSNNYALECEAKILTALKVLEANLIKNSTLLDSSVFKSEIHNTDVCNIEPCNQSEIDTPLEANSDFKYTNSSSGLEKSDDIHFKNLVITENTNNNDFGNESLQTKCEFDTSDNIKNEFGILESNNSFVIDDETLKVWSKLYNNDRETTLCNDGTSNPRLLSHQFEFELHNTTESRRKNELLNKGREVIKCKSNDLKPTCTQHDHITDDLLDMTQKFRDIAIMHGEILQRDNKMLQKTIEVQEKNLDNVRTANRSIKEYSRFQNLSIFQEILILLVGVIITIILFFLIILT